MKQKPYQKPAMQVVRLQQQPQLLQSSGQAGLEQYGWNEYQQD